MKREMIVMIVFLASLGAVYVANSVQGAAAADERTLLRVGVYDSRGIAIAYCNSEYWSKVLREKQAALEQAKKDGDTEKVKEIESWGPAQQARAHLMGFGTAPVHECLEAVKDRIPEVANAAGVDVIVSKWELDYLAADTEVVDVTVELAKLFTPSERAWKSIEALDQWKPYSREELERLEKQNPNF